MILKDSIVLIPHDTTIINYRDSIILIPHDTLIIHIKDSLVYNFRDTLLYNLQRFNNCLYDERTFPEESIERYLNLFFQTDNLEDTAGLRFNFSIFDGRRRSYILDTNYRVLDSVTGWKLDWNYNEQITIQKIRMR